MKENLLTKSTWQNDNCREYQRQLKTIYYSHGHNQIIKIVNQTLEIFKLIQNQLRPY